MRCRRCKNICCKRISARLDDPPLSADLIGSVHAVCPQTPLYPGGLECQSRACPINLHGNCAMQNRCPLAATCAGPMDRVGVSKRNGTRCPAATEMQCATGRAQQSGKTGEMKARHALQVQADCAAMMVSCWDGDGTVLVGGWSARSTVVAERDDDRGEKSMAAGLRVASKKDPSRPRSRESPHDETYFVRISFPSLVVLSW